MGSRRSALRAGMRQAASAPTVGTQIGECGLNTIRTIRNGSRRCH